MGVSQAAQQRINKEKQLTEQIIYNPEFQLDGIQALPHTDFLRTNSFVQGTASRLFAKNVDAKKWFPLNVDDQGRLILSPQTTPGAQIFIKDRNFTDAVVIENVSVPNNAAISHVGVDISSLSRKTVLVDCNGPVTVRFQVSNDDISWYNVFDTNDSEFTMAVDNTKKAIEFIDAAHFMRLVITNTSGGALTITAVIEGIT